MFPALALVIVSSVLSCPETLIHHEKSLVRNLKDAYWHKQAPWDELWRQCPQVLLLMRFLCCLYALHGGKAEADKGTRLPDMASQQACLGVEFEVTSSLICYVFMGPSFFLCSKLSLNALFLSCSSKHSGNVEIM